MPIKYHHEVRDPVHGFISYSTAERGVIDSVPFQRLRNIHQLALTYLVYPGATHRRFEHSLGVMELATRIFDEITAPEKLRQLPDSTYASLPSLGARAEFDRGYWLQVLRMGALCHDLGHLPFSHAAEKELLPRGVKHEHISWDIIFSDLMAAHWKRLKIDPEHVAKVAVGKKDAPPGIEFDVWETLLAEIVVGDVFGADRMDYLLRDAHHAGVAYGKFDHLRLIKTLRILPKQEGEGEDDSRVAEPCIGIERGGLQAAESLLWARYLMFSQVYLHPVRRIYDIHLKDFMLALLGGDLIPSSELDKFIAITDIEILHAMRKTAKDPKHPACEHARRILDRNHFKLAWEKSARECLANPDIATDVHDLLGREFGVDNVRLDTYEKSGLAPDFPVLMTNREVTSACNESKILLNMPPAEISCIFVRPDLRDKAAAWIKKNRDQLVPFQLGEGGEP